MTSSYKSYFYYPTTTVLIDDDKKFLDGLRGFLNSKGDKIVKTFSNPEEALFYLKDRENIYKNASAYLESINNIELDYDNKDKISKINFDSIIKLPYEKKRYDEISVIVVDYFMPQMNGIEFFKEIKDIPAKKILLTGNNDYELAVSAFNEGLFDKFIVKERGMERKLFEFIDVLKKEYFQDFSEHLLYAFDKNINNVQKYNSIFSKWCAENKISEYYRCDGDGSYIGFNDKGEIQWFLICSEADLNHYIEIAEEEKRPPLILKDLKSKEKMLFLMTEKEQMLPLSEWGNYAFPICGDFTNSNEKYFYSFTSKSLGIDLKRIAKL